MWSWLKSRKVVSGLCCQWKKAGSWAWIIKQVQIINGLLSC